MRFILNALDVSENELLREASRLKNDADSIYNASTTGRESVIRFALNVRDLKRTILERQVSGKIKILLHLSIIH